MRAKNIFYAQSGGVTAVINGTAAAIIETAKQYPDVFGKVYAGHNGIAGALKEELIDTSLETEETITALRHTPGGAFGSCRYKLQDFNVDDSEYKRLVAIFKAHNIGYFFYNGGNDSQDTTHKISQYCQKIGFPLQCIGIPKTVDNDLAVTDCCPGFASVAKYIATTIRECALDLASMCATSSNVFIMEVMGRHAGWIAAAAGLAKTHASDGPHLILFPEITFNPELFYQRVHNIITEHGFCVIVVAEGIKNDAGEFVTDSRVTDAFGHHKLGGVAPMLADLLSHLHGYKCHWAVPDYLQRSARHLASAVDVEQSYAIGTAAIEAAHKGKNGLMITIKRLQDEPYRWTTDEAPLSIVANQEKILPRDFISPDGFSITEKAKRYLLPLIQGENYPPYKNGMPNYARLAKHLVPKKIN